MIGDIISPTHLLFILVVALVLLGPKKLPEIGRSLGRGVRDFRGGLQGTHDDARGVFRGARDEPAANTVEESAEVASDVVAPAPHLVVSPRADADSAPPVPHTSAAVAVEKADSSA